MVLDVGYQSKIRSAPACQGLDSFPFNFGRFPLVDGHQTGLLEYITQLPKRYRPILAPAAGHMPYRIQPSVKTRMDAL